MLDRLRIRSLPRAFVALAMLATLLLGSVGHAWHHYLDRDCDSHAGTSASPCGVCAGLHAAQVQGETTAVRVPVPLLLGTVATAIYDAPDAARSCAVPARAPPTA